MIRQIPIIAEVFCPKINNRSNINLCIDCCYYKGTEKGSIILCDYNDVTHE